MYAELHCERHAKLVHTCRDCRAAAILGVQARPTWDRQAVRKRIQDLCDSLDAEVLARLRGTSTGVEMHEMVVQSLTSIAQYAAAKAAGESTTILLKSFDVLAQLVEHDLPSDDAKVEPDGTVIEADGTTSVDAAGNILDPEQAMAFDLTAITEPMRDAAGEIIPPSMLRAHRCVTCSIR